MPAIIPKFVYEMEPDQLVVLRLQGGYRVIDPINGEREVTRADFDRALSAALLRRLAPNAWELSEHGRGVNDKFSRFRTNGLTNGPR